MYLWPYGLVVNCFLSETLGYLEELSICNQVTKKNMFVSVFKGSDFGSKQAPIICTN